MSKSKAAALARQHGAELEEFTDGLAALSADAWTPAGVVWVASGCHSLVAYDYTSRAAGWADLIQRMKLGTEPCTTEACDTCDPAD